MKKRENMATFHNRMRKNTERVSTYHLYVNPTLDVTEEAVEVIAEQETPSKKKKKNNKK